MKISKIYSTRKINKEVYSDLIYEWEDGFSQNLDIPVYSYHNTKERIIRRFFRFLYDFKILSLFQKFDSLRNTKSKILVFELYPRTSFSYEVFSNKIPYIIDFDLNVNLEIFNSVYKNCKLILISSLVAFNYLKKNNCPLNIAHLPLSISDNYKIDIDSYKNREFDVIVTRTNKVIKGYLEKYSEDHPDFEFVVRRWEGTQMYRNNVYFSNLRGILGEFSERSSYFGLLKKARVAVYATPGYDEDAKRFMNHVTPSLFEFISSGCRIIARYPENEETNYFELENLSPSIESYEQFKEVLTSYLDNNSDDYIKASQDFLQRVYTKKQIGKLILILKNNS